MAHVVVLGGGIGGVSSAYEIRQAVRKEDRVTLVSNKPFFQFTPSNPWVAVKWRSKNDITIDLASVLPRHGVQFNGAGAKRVYPEENRVELGDGSSLTYDYLVIATGPELAFDEIDGLGPDNNTSSVCDVDHAAVASRRWDEFCKDPGPIVVGAVQGASCYGPAYEFAMIMDADLRKRRIRDKVPMTFVTAEPYIGHLGVGGVGDTKGHARIRDCASTTSNGSPTPRSTRSKRGKLHVTEVDDDGKPKKAHELPFQVLDDAAGVSAALPPCAASTAWSIHAASSSSISISAIQNSSTYSASACASLSRRLKRRRSRSACRRPAS